MPHVRDRHPDLPLLEGEIHEQSVVLITGALTGIGRATAFAFAHDGARIVVSGRRDDAGEALGRRARTSARKLNSFAPTYATRTRCEDLVDKTVARFGRLDVAVNNAGTEGKPGPITGKPPKATPPPSTPMCSACSSA